MLHALKSEHRIVDPKEHGLTRKEAPDEGHGGLDRRLGIRGGAPSDRGHDGRRIAYDGGHDRLSSDLVAPVRTDAQRSFS